MKQIEGQISIFDFIHENEKQDDFGRGGVFRYLRHGPHTLIPEVRERTKKWLEKHGVPEFVTWDKDSLPCQNCTWFDGTNCCQGGHTCHYEFGYLICDGFYQSIVERKPSTVGDAFPTKILAYPVDIMGLCDDAYCPKCGDAIDEFKWMDCERCPSCGARISWEPWHRKNDEDNENLFGPDWRDRFGKKVIKTKDEKDLRRV